MDHVLINTALINSALTISVHFHLVVTVIVRINCALVDIRQVKLLVGSHFYVEMASTFTYYEKKRDYLFDDICFFRSNIS